MNEHVEQIPIISELTLKLFYYLFLFSQRNKTLKSTRWFKASVNVEYYRIIGYSKYWKKRSFANFKYIYMYTRPKIYRLKKRRKKFRAETAPRTEIKGHVSGIQIHGGVYNMVVSSNVRFIRDAHARTPNSALIVNTWKVWFGYGDHVLHACISSQGKTRRNGGEKRGWRERGERGGYECIANIARYLFCLDGGAVFWFERISIELVFYLRVCDSSLACVRAHTCVSHEGSRRPSIHWTRRQKLARTAGLKSFLNPVRRLNSLSNIEGS